MNQHTMKIGYVCVSTDAQELHLNETGVTRYIQKKRLERRLDRLGHLIETVNG